MTKRLRYILYAIIAVVAIGVVIWVTAYLPHFSGTLSGDNADWGNFGQFFFGLGTMLFSGLTVFVIMGIDTQLQRSNIINRYEEKLKDIQKITESKSQFEVRCAILNMCNFLLMITVNENFSKDIQRKALSFVKEINKIGLNSFAEGLKPNDTNGNKLNMQQIEFFSKWAASLNSFLTELVANKVIKLEMSDACATDEQTKQNSKKEF